MSSQAYCHAVNIKCKNTIDKFVLMMIADFADQNNSCSGNIPLLMHICQLSESEVVESIKSLMDDDLLRIGEIDGLRRYILNFPLPY